MRAVAAIAVLLLVAACQAPPAEMTGAERAQQEAQVREAVTEALSSLQTDFLSNDAERFLSHWTPDMRVLEPGMDMARAEFEEMIREFWDTGGVISAFDVDPFEVFVHGDVAYQIGQYREAYQFPDAEPDELYYNFFARWEKQSDGAWRIDRWVGGPVDEPTEG